MWSLMQTENPNVISFCRQFVSYYTDRIPRLAQISQAALTQQGNRYPISWLAHSLPVRLAIQSSVTLADHDTYTKSWLYVRTEGTLLYVYVHKG